MSMLDWAEQECRIACKRENPKFDFDNEKDWDYGCSCYKSALKAYQSLCNDDHSGYSFNVTKNILIRLMEGQPLTPITDEDFFVRANGTEVQSLESPEYLKERGLKSNIQCPRMSSLFREETLDGKVSYHDIDRAYYINIEEPSDTYSSWDGFIDEMFPITMPYMPKKGKYKIYAQTFLTDKKHGDFDTKGIFYVITPEGEKVDINLFRTEGDDGKWKVISKEEYDVLLSKRVDKLNEKIASHLLWTLISNSSSEEERERREKAYKERKQWLEELFPELKESKDEKIRKEIIEFVDINTLSVDERHDRWIAWLEKQGNQKPVISDDALREGITHFGITQYQIDDWLKKYVNVEKQGEQKPADKVESKFKVGDWIYHEISGNAFHINRIENRTYISDEGATISFGRQNDWRLWTISDAKDGDVLISTWKGCPYIYIFKEVDNNIIISHIFYYPELDAIDMGVINMDNTPTVPATKEQRDTLEKAMADAGYEWLDKDRKLIKIVK